MKDASPKEDFRKRLAQQIRDFLRAIDDRAPGGHERPAWRVTARRVIAFALDGLLLAAVGNIIAMLAREELLFLGENGWWIGTVIVALYFTYFDSAWGGGKTPGKRLTGIEVQGVSGLHIPPYDALLRYVPFGLVNVISAIAIYASAYALLINLLELFAVLISLAIIIFGLFHPQRRSIHDLLLNTVVVRSRREYRLPHVSIRRPLIIFLIAGTIVGGGIFSVDWYVVGIPTARTLGYLEGVITAQGDVRHPRLHVELLSRPGGGLARTLVATAFIPDQHLATNPVALELLADEVSVALAASGHVPPDIRQIVVELKSGFDIGIGGELATRSYSYPYHPEIKVDPNLHIKTTPGTSQQ